MKFAIFISVDNNYFQSHFWQDEFIDFDLLLMYRYYGSDSSCKKITTQERSSHHLLLWNRSRMLNIIFAYKDWEIFNTPGMSDRIKGNFEMGEMVPMINIFQFHCLWCVSWVVYCVMAVWTMPWSRTLNIFDLQAGRKLWCDNEKSCTFTLIFYLINLWDTF